MDDEGGQEDEDASEDEVGKEETSRRCEEEGGQGRR